MLAARATEQRTRSEGFTPVPRRKRLSTRGEQHGYDTHPTKKWTPGRMRVENTPHPETPLVVQFLYAGMTL